MYGNDFRYAASRLVGSIILLDGEPIFIDDMDGDTGRAFYHTLITGDVDSCAFKKLDLSPLELGYVNTPQFGALYVVRKPMRRDWRQGIRHQNLTILKRDINVRHVDYRFLAQTIKGNYPKLVNLLAAAEAGDLDKSAAWCRQFSLHPNFTVDYCGERVGHANHKTGEVVLKEEFAYLNEALEETL